MGNPRRCGSRLTPYTRYSGTFGQLVPGLDPTEDTTLRPGRIGHLAQLLQTDAATGRRTNIGLVNLSDELVRVARGR